MCVCVCVYGSKHLLTKKCLCLFYVFVYIVNALYEKGNWMADKKKKRR